MRSTRSSGRGLAACVLGVLLLVQGCGPSGKSLDEAEARIAALKQRGATDTQLSGAKVHIFQARGAMRSGNSPLAKKHADSALILVTAAENEFAEKMQKVRPYVDSLRASIDERKKQLTGLHLEDANEMLVPIDSFIKTNWLFQASQKLAQMDTAMVQLFKDEEMAKKTRRKVIGKWSRSDPEGNAVRKEMIVFKKDGSLTTEETKKGQSTEYLKEDWAFKSSGTWDMKGDTAYLSIEREQCLRQDYWNLKKGKWVKAPMPTYDSTVTDGSKDRFVTYEYLTTDFKRR